MRGEHSQSVRERCVSPYCNESRLARATPSGKVRLTSSSRKSQKSERLTNLVEVPSEAVVKNG
eukprot:1491300-Pleurochrysis_carterae.AAC.1